MGSRRQTQQLGLNVGSGQRRFDSVDDVQWVNIDSVDRPDQHPDQLIDVGSEPLPYDDGTVDYCVLHQVYEHFGLGEGERVIRECHRVLRNKGSLILTMPDMKALAQRWLLGQITDYIYFVNVYGAYQGEPGDRHKWGYSYDSLAADLCSMEDVRWSAARKFDWRPIPGASLAKDWWILGMEFIK
jgi:SAM-dependent methyltransferase